MLSRQVPAELDRRAEGSSPRGACSLGARAQPIPNQLASVEQRGLVARSRRAKEDRATEAPAPTSRPGERVGVGSGSAGFDLLVLPEHKPTRDLGGEAGIRTLGPVSGSAVFKTAPFDHSGTSPHRKPVDHHRGRSTGLRQVAERQGFEPWDPLLDQRFSRPSRSTAPAPLREMQGASPRSMKCCGGEGGIRTLGTFRFTRFPVVPIRPLSHLSASPRRRRRNPYV